MCVGSKVVFPGVWQRKRTGVSLTCRQHLEEEVLTRGWHLAYVTPLAVEGIGYASRYLFMYLFVGI